MSIIHLEERIAELVRICDKQTKENDALKALVIRKDEALSYALAGIHGELGPVNNTPSLVITETLALTPADLARSVVVKREEWEWFLADYRRRYGHDWEKSNKGKSY